MEWGAAGLGLTAKQVETEAAEVVDIALQAPIKTLPSANRKDFTKPLIRFCIYGIILLEGNHGKNMHRKKTI